MPSRVKMKPANRNGPVVEVWEVQADTLKANGYEIVTDEPAKVAKKKTARKPKAPAE